MECHRPCFFFVAQLLQVVEMDLLHDLALSGASGKTHRWCCLIAKRQVGQWSHFSSLSDPPLSCKGSIQNFYTWNNPRKRKHFTHKGHLLMFLELCALYVFFGVFLSSFIIGLGHDKTCWSIQPPTSLHFLPLWWGRPIDARDPIPYEKKAPLQAAAGIGVFFVGRKNYLFAVFVDTYPPGN